MIPTRIETHIVEPHRNPALQTAARGLVIAVARCGRWPVSATLDDYQDAVDRAQLEVCRIGLVEERYCWQFRRPIDDSEPVLVRLMMQRDAALALCPAAGRVRAAADGPAAGVGVTSAVNTLLTRRGREHEVWTGRKVAELSADELRQASAAGYEPDDAGVYLAGRDPRRMKPDEIRAIGHQPSSPMDAIRAKCLDCCAGSAHEVRLCVAIACPSWPFRTGKNPWRAPISEERREALRERGARLSGQRKINALGTGTAPPATTLPAEALRSPEQRKIEVSPAVPRFARGTPR